MQDSSAATRTAAATPAPGPDFDDFYRREVAAIVGQVYALVGSLGEAEDVVQEAFARAWPRWSRVRTYERPDAWVRKVAFRLAVSRSRRVATAVRLRHRVEPTLSSEGPGPDTVAVVAALRRLPLAQRRALVLHHMAGHSVAEIAALEGVPEGTIKARLSRGRAALAPHLAEESS